MASLAGFMSESKVMGSHEARVAVEAVDDMMWTRCCEDLCGDGTGDCRQTL